MHRYIVTVVLSILFNNLIFAQLGQLSDYDKLRMMDGEFAIKVGSIYVDTPKEIQDKLFDLEEVIAISNPDKTIDFVFHKSYADYAKADSIRKKFNEKNFPEAQLGFVYVDDFSVKFLVGDAGKDKYTVSLGSFNGLVPQNEIDKILSIPNVKSIELTNPNRTVYILGVYDSQQDARAVVLELLNQGIASDVLRFEKGVIKDIDPNILFSAEEIEKIKTQKNTPINIKTEKVVFRVQIGAFSKKIPKTTFKGVNVIEFKAPNGLNKYVTGSYLSYEEAYVFKLKMKTSGYPGAFIVAFKDGKLQKISDLVTQEQFMEIEKKHAVPQQ